MSYYYHLIENQKFDFSNSYFQINNSGKFDLKADLILPDCTPGIMVIKEGNLIRKHQGKVESFQAGKIYLFGQKTFAAEYIFDQESFQAYGYKLHPGGLYLYFGIKAEELTDSSIILSESELPSLEFPLFPKNPSANHLNDKLVLNLILEIHAKNGDITIQSLAKKFDIGYKRAERLFRQYVGISPKMYARIVRFNFSVKLFNHPLYTLTDIAYQAGYFDQNHFIKETVKFTGYTPSKLLKLKNAGLEKSQLSYLNSRGF